MRDDELITDGQRMALNRLVGNNLPRAKRLWIISHMIGRSVSTSKALTVGEWRTIRNFAHPNWREGDWDTLSAKFRTDLADWNQIYDEQVLGQQRLF